MLAGVNKYCPPNPVVKFRVTKDATTIFDSKIGGVPYFPKTMEYPRGKSEDQPLVLLAQINLSDLPDLPDFPHEGILQFFIAGDDLYGMGVDGLDVQDDFRIIYHKEIISDISQLMTAEDIPQNSGEDEIYLPFEGEYKLIAQAADPMPVTTSDYRFESAFVSSYNELHETPIKQIWDVDSNVLYDDMDKLANDSAQLNKMDYAPVNNRLQELRKASLEWLRHALFSKKTSTGMRIYESEVVNKRSITK